MGYSKTYQQMYNDGESGDVAGGDGQVLISKKLVFWARKL